MTGNTGKNMCQRVHSAQAAAELGVHVAYMHQQMKNGVWDLGEVVAPHQKERKEKLCIPCIPGQVRQSYKGRGKIILGNRRIQKAKFKIYKN